MLTLFAQIHIDPSDREAFIRAAKACTEASKTEPGCLAYEFSADLSDPSRFYCFEAWASDAHFQVHSDAPHHREYMARAVLGTAGRRLKKSQAMRFVSELMTDDEMTKRGLHLISKVLYEAKDTREALKSLGYTEAELKTATTPLV